MYKVIRGLISHKGKSYRKGDSLPETFTNKEGYKHVEWNGKGTGPTVKDKAAENAQIKKLQKEAVSIKAENAGLNDKVTELEAKLLNIKVDVVNNSSVMLDVETEVTDDGVVVMFSEKDEAINPVKADK